MYYAKTEPKETIREHTDKLLENLKLLRKLYGRRILENTEIDEERFWKLLEIVCTYHDIGKVYTPFQNIIRKKIGEPTIKTDFNYDIIKHEQISPMFVPVGKYNLSKDEKKLVYQAIYYHHERENNEINSTFVKKVIEEDIKPQIEKIKNEIGYEINEKPDIIYIKYVKSEKRIKENDDLYVEYCLLKGLLHRLDYSSSAEMQIEDATLENIAQYVEKFIKETKNSKLNEIQNFCDENANENLLIIGSTGIGKTEASLLWSNGDKTFFTLPLRTSINAIYDRIEDDIKYNHTGLLHSTALEYLKEKDEFKNQEEKYNQTKNLFEKVTTCTIDQIFPFVFKYKGYERIYATLSYSKIIIDEIQAYSPEIVAAILKGIEMINRIGGKFMIMTATLPRLYKEELERQGINFKFEKFINPTIRHKIKLEDKKIEEATEDIIQKGQNNKILIIVNTINKAIELYFKLKNEGAKNINLLHSRFIYNDRIEKEKNIMKFSNNKTDKGIWITTQIVEASIDIDFDYLYTEISTLDSLFQRLGRCYRNRKYDKEEANVYIYTKEASGIKYVYDEEITQKSIELLKEYDNKIIEENTKVDLVDKLYSEEMLKDTKFLQTFKSGLESLKNIIDYKTSRKIAQKILRNIENITVIPKNIYEQELELFKEYEAEKEDYKRKNAIKGKIDRLTVSISGNQRRNINDKLTENPYYKNTFIADLKYRNEFGLILRQDEEYNLNERIL